MAIRISYDPADLKLVIPVLDRFGKDCGLEAVWGPLHQSSFLKCWGAMLSAGISFLVLLEKEGEVVGAAGVCIAPSTYWSFLMASETFWYVYPEHRAGTGAVRMLKVAEEEAKRRGCKVIAAGHKVFWNAESMERLYKARGYRPHDLIYVKEI